MKNYIIFFMFVLLIAGCTHQHKKGISLGGFASDREVGMFHVRNKSEYRIIGLTENQIAKINKLLGRKVSFNVVNCRRIYSKIGGNKRGAYKGNMYKIEQNLDSVKIVILLGIHKGRLAEIKVTGEGVSISNDLFVYFLNHSFRHFSDDIATLAQKGKLADAGGAFSHKVHITKGKYKEDMEQLNRLEKDHSILSFIEECLAADMVIS